MDYKEALQQGDSVVIKGVENFAIKQILECGQCFRWQKITDEDYIVVSNRRVIEIIQNGDEVTIHNTTLEDFNNIWFEYFDLGRDYSKIKDELSKDEILKKSVDYGYGIRILSQEPFELVISFIISARNSIPSIKKTIKKISERWGKEIEYNGEKFYTFPTPEMLKDATEDDIRETGASFRSKYIVDTVFNINKDLDNIDGVYNLKRIASLSDDECHTALQEFKGVGAKVADCIMLFSMKKYSAFPVDVWVKRAMMHFYNAKEGSLNKIRIFARDKFKDLSGFAQQYLFYYARENNIKID